MSIIFAILLFSILIFVHELGHFLAAKASGVRVNEFSMFMGPAILKKQKGETLYSLRCIPIGGYCAMEGEDEDTEDPRSFQKARWWKRLIILLAGSFMNLVAGFLILVIVFAPAVTALSIAAARKSGSLRVASSATNSTSVQSEAHLLISSPIISNTAPLFL